MTRTNSNTNWDVKMLSWKFGDNKGFSDKSDLVRFDPGLPYVYLSKSKYKMFTETMNTAYPDDYPCKKNSNVCIFKKTCKAVMALNKGVDLKFEIADENNYNDYKMTTDDLLVDGDKFSEGVDTQCRLAVFDHGDAAEKEIFILGNLFLKNYYLVFDMSYLETDLNFLQVGLALVNPGDAAGARKHYDTKAGDLFKPTLKSLDSSSIKSGETDQYPAESGQQQTAEEAKAAELKLMQSIAHSAIYTGQLTQEQFVTLEMDKKDNYVYRYNAGKLANKAWTGAKAQLEREDTYDKAEL